MDLGLLGMDDFSFEDMSYDVIVMGECDLEGKFSGEASWQAVVLSPFGYEVCLVDYENVPYILEGAKANGIYVTNDPLKEVEKAKVLSVSGLFQQFSRKKELIKEIFIQASKNNTLVCVDPGQIIDLESAKQMMNELAPYIDYFLPNQEEASLLSGKDTPPEMAGYFIEMGMKNVVITNGNYGCFVKNKEGAPFAMGAIWGVDVVNDEGVGANFAAGFVHGLFQDWQMKTICEFACGCAAASLAYASPIEEARSRKESVKKLLNNPWM